MSWFYLPPLPTLTHTHTHTHIIQSHCDVKMLTICRNYEELLSQGRMWEQNGEYGTAIDLYLELTTQNCSDNDLLQTTWEKVGRVIICQNVTISLSFLPSVSTLH